MDSEEARRVLLRRVQSLDAENGLKIMGYLLLQGWGEQDLLRLAFSSDYTLQSYIAIVKSDLGLTPPPKSKLNTNDPYLSNNPSYLSYHQFESGSESEPQTGVLARQHLKYARLPALTKLREDNPSKIFSPAYDLDSHSRLHLNDLLTCQSNCYSEEPATGPLLRNASFLSQQFNANMSLFHNNNQNYSYELMPPYISKQSMAGVSVPSGYPFISTSHTKLKPCLYFARGYCKHGTNCRFSHINTNRDRSSSPGFVDDEDSTSLDEYTYGNWSPSSLHSLEAELKELLRGTKQPVSIASLPQLYLEKFGKTLQAEGYLTESQRHGKPGYSLTKLLSKLRNTVMIVDRPHGQHAVILVEDEQKFKESGGYLSDVNEINSSSRQIYLTFPAESTFTEEDVIVHFRAYGAVHDVRIPYQQKRMFGFVSFMYSDTVRTILAEGNPHYICGCRVLVKPYKEKAKLNVERKVVEREYNASMECKINEELKLLLDLNLKKKEEEDDVMKRQCPLLDCQDESTLIDNGMSLTAEDCFQLQPSVFSCVLDVLESDGKEDYDHTSDIRFSDLTLEGNPFTNVKSVSDEAIKINNVILNKQISLSTPCNWSQPSLFSWSVY